MGVLSNVEIVAALWNEELSIAPLVNLRRQLSFAALDVRLGPDFVVKELSRERYMDPVELSARWRSDRSRIDRLYRRIKHVDVSDPFVLHPGEFVLGSTLEFVGLSESIKARLEGKSHWAREGLRVHSTASFIQPGSRDVITLELENAGAVPICLYVGMRVAQLEFERLDVAPVGSSVRDPEKSDYLTCGYGRPWLDPDFASIARRKAALVRA